MKGKISRLVWSLIVLAVAAFAAHAERLPVKTYTVADGLLRDKISKIRQDSRGFLWLCTDEGISRFDGAAMTNFTTADGLPNPVVEDFLETREGTIYIATGKGLARLNPRGIRGSTENPLFKVFLPDSERAAEIQILYEDRNDQVWVGTSDGLYKLIPTGDSIAFELVPLGEPLKSSGGAIAEPNPNALAVSAILEDRRGALWVGTYGGGLFRLSPGGVRRFTADEDKFGDNKITDLLETRDGRFWMSMRSDEQGGVCLLDATADEHPIRKCYTTRDGLSANWVRSLLQTSDGQIWLATLSGLCRWQTDANGEAVCKTYTAKNDLCDEAISLAEDKDGNLWMGSPCGAKKIARYGFTTYTAADGLDYDDITSIFENRAGELFAAAFPRYARVINRFDGEKFSPVKPRLPGYVNYHGWGWQQTVWQDSRGAWWIPSGYGIFRSPDDTPFENLARVPLKKENYGGKGLDVFRLFEDSRGDIWMATTTAADELFRWERATNLWHDYTTQVGFSDLRVGTAFVEDRFGNIWIGASSDHGASALIRYRNGEFRVLTEAENAPSGWIWDLFLDSRGRLWIASTDSGVWRLDETNYDRFDFKRYTPADGLASVSATSITEDEFGRIYIGSWRGIDRLTPDTGQIENFTTDDGLPASFVEAAYRDRKNNLWFGTDKGLARFVPEPVRERKPPTMLITSLRVEGVPQSVSILGETYISQINLSSQQRQITVDFLGLGASPGEKLKYEYRLGNSDWMPTMERTVNFANLAAGSYQFEVRAVTADRIASSPATLAFHIAAPVYLRPWFVASMVILTGLIIFAFYRYRLNKLLEIERTRTRIATDLHDDIGTNLSKISLLSEIVNLQLAGQNSESHRLLRSIAEISRESVSSMSDIVWAINPQRDTFLELVRRMRLHVEEISLDNNLRVQFNAPEDGADIKLSMNTRRELFLIFKEAVSNAARHAECTELKVDFIRQHNAIHLYVADNGKGFDARQKTDGNGLENMRSRAEKNGGEFSIESAAGRGTIIKICFPQT